ncbi:MAG: N-acetyltransferase family protein [Actinomycetota bacterium]
MRSSGRPSRRCSAATPPSCPDVIVRPAVADDIPRLTEIYNHYVESSQATFDVEPVTIEQRREWFSHYSSTGPHRLLVAVDVVVVGFASSSPFRARAAYATSIETSVYVDVERARAGIGSALYEQLFEDLVGEEIHRAYAGIALPNDASIALHERFGFELVGVYTEVGRKFGRYWDVAWYEKALE